MREFDTNGLRLCELQAFIFQESKDRFDCSTKVFFRRFLHSNILDVLDENESALVYFDEDDALNEIEEQFGKSEYGKEKFTYDQLFWIGYIYRYISYTRDMSTPLVVFYFPLEKMKEAYYVYHTQSEEWCISSLLTALELNENIFDKNYRMKEIIRKSLLLD